MRVYELAKQLGLSSKETIARLNALGVEVSSHASNVSDEDAARLSPDPSRHATITTSPTRNSSATNGSALSAELVPGVAGGARTIPHPDGSSPDEIAAAQGLARFIQKVSSARRSWAARSVWDDPPPDPQEQEQTEARKASLHLVRLFRYVLPRWRGLLLILLAMGLTVGFQLLQPWPMKLLVDQVLHHETWPHGLHKIIKFLPGPSGRHGLLLWLVVGTVLVYILATLASMLYTVAAVAVGQRITYALGADLFNHLQKLSLIFHSKRPVGDTIQRVTLDPYCLQTLVSSAALPLLQAVLTIGAMFFIMWRLQPSLALLAMAVVPFLYVAIRAFKEPMREQSRIRYDLEGHMMTVVEQTLNAIPVVQAFNRQEREHARFQSYADQTVKAYVRSTMTDMWFKLFAGLVTIAGTAGIMYVGAQNVLNGSMSVGTMLVFIAYLASLYGPMDTITYSASSVQHAAAQADRIQEILESTHDVAEPATPIEPSLQGHVRYEDVTFGYEPKRPVLKGISLEANPGDVVAIVGPTGAGKTTLVNMLVRFFDPQSGVISIDGNDIRTLSLNCLREQIALVLQDPFIFPLSIAENIAYGKPDDATKEQVQAAAMAANAHDFITALPDGYDTIVGQRGATLSGGEKQRLSIARAFLKDAPILILDEPTSALDAVTESLLLDALERLMEGRVTFIIAHRLSTIRHADQILVMDKGTIVERGTHEELLENNALYSRLYNRQTDVAEHLVVDSKVMDQIRDTLLGAI